MRATVLVELSRYREYCNDLPGARAILAQAKKDSSHEWKVFLESVLLEIRAKNLSQALDQVKEALKVEHLPPKAQHSDSCEYWTFVGCVDSTDPFDSVGIE